MVAKFTRPLYYSFLNSKLKIYFKICLKSLLRKKITTQKSTQSFRLFKMIREKKRKLHSFHISYFISLLCCHCHILIFFFILKTSTHNSFNKQSQIYSFSSKQKLFFKYKSITQWIRIMQITNSIGACMDTLHCEYQLCPLPTISSTIIKG